MYCYSAVVRRPPTRIHAHRQKAAKMRLYDLDKANRRQKKAERGGGDDLFLADKRRIETESGEEKGNEGFHGNSNCRKS